MEKATVRSDFIIKDLVVSLPRERGSGTGGTFLPAEDGPPLPWWLSPVAAVAANGAIFESVRGVITDALEHKADLSGIAQAFSEGDPDGNPAIRQAIHEIGSAVVASAAYTAVGGAIGYPNPDCGGSSMETIPPTLTPIVHKGTDIHRVAALPKLRKQLTEAVEALDRAAAALEPRGDEVRIVAKHLEAARASLNGH
jgi:hypothetical protein